MTPTLEPHIPDRDQDADAPALSGDALYQYRWWLEGLPPASEIDGEEIVEQYKEAA